MGVMLIVLRPCESLLFQLRSLELCLPSLLHVALLSVESSVVALQISLRWISVRSRLSRRMMVRFGSEGGQGQSHVVTRAPMSYALADSETIFFNSANLP